MFLDEALSPVAAEFQGAPVLAVARAVSDGNAYLRSNVDVLGRERWTVAVPGAKRSDFDPSL